MKKLIVILFTLFSLPSFAQRAATDYGDIYYEFFQFKEAARYYEEALPKSTKPNKTQYLYLQLSQCYKYLFQYRKSEEYFEKYMTSGADIKPEYYIDYGNILKLNGKYKEAKNQFKKYQEVTGTDLAEPFIRSVNWAIHNKDTIKNYVIAPTDLNISGQALGYCFYDDGLIYAHARNKKPMGKNGAPLFDLDYARKMSVTEFQPDMALLSLIEFDLNEGSPCVSRDNQTLYFSANATSLKKGKKKMIGSIEVSEEGVSNFKIYSATSEGGVFQNPVALSFNDNNYSCIHPFIMDDGVTLIFSSNMPGGFGGFDLYKSSLTMEGTWGEPINLGRVVNTEENELFPWVSDGMLYFSSKGFNNYGGYDVFIAKLNKLLMPSVLKNIGQPINSFRDDVAFITKDGGRTGYFSSNRDNEEGADQVYFFNEHIGPKVLDEPEPVKAIDTIPIASAETKQPSTPETTPTKVAPVVPAAVAAVAATIPDKKMEPAIAAMETDKSNKPLEPTKAAPVIASVPAKKAEPIKTVPKVAATTPKSVTKEVPQEILNKQFTPVPFKFNDASISTTQMEAADSVALLLKENPSLKVYIAAHTDSRGSFSYNMSLADRRAAAVKRYLLSKGVSSKRIIVRGLGESQLLNECADGVYCTHAQHAVNRRVEMRLVK